MLAEVTGLREPPSLTGSLGFAAAALPFVGSANGCAVTLLRFESYLMIDESIF